MARREVFRFLTGERLNQLATLVGLVSFPHFFDALW